MKTLLKKKKPSNMSLRLCILSMLLLSHSLFVNAQQLSNSLSEAEFIAVVKLYHPAIKLSELATAKSKQDLLGNKGQLDPTAYFNSASKTFDGSNYYNYTEAALKVPIWYGIDVIAGTENLNGKKTDPTESLGKTNYLSVNIPLTKNLFLDKRNTILKQSREMLRLTEIEQLKVKNDILYEAVQCYWNWSKQYFVLQIIEQNLTVNRARIEFVRRSVLGGERPAIDTTEAITQLQSFEYQYLQRLTDFKNTGLELSTYLWTKDDKPYELPNEIKPTTFSFFDVSDLTFTQQLINEAMQNHPELMMYESKLKILGIEKKLKQQDLMPKFDVQYNLLGKGYNLYQTASTSAFLQNNYRYGIKFEMPLRLSQSRADFSKSKIKIKESLVQQSQKQQSIEVKIKSYLNEMKMLEEQRKLQNDNYNYCKLLVNAEEQRFRGGESSLFIINSRENKALESYEKLLDVQTKYYKTISALKWSAGILYK
jgi:outer membrane protein TolC